MLLQGQGQVLALGCRGRGAAAGEDRVQLHYAVTVSSLRGGGEEGGEEGRG